MDKIYSRKRIKIFYSDKKTIKKKIVIILIIVIAIATITIGLKSLNPIFEELCREKALQVSTDILNRKSTLAIRKYNYKDIVTVIKDDANDTRVLKTDVSTINDMASDIATEVNKELVGLKKEQIKIPVGALSGNKYLSGFGPNIKISIIPDGAVTTDLKTEFKAQGINQTIYRIYLEVKCNINIATPYKIITSEITNQVLLVETVIVGNVPETYYNLDGINEKTTLELIK